jgi:hypothetical protein
MTLGFAAVVRTLIRMNQSNGGVSTAVLVIASYAAGIGISIWQVVGIWRSASHHAERGGSRGWAAIAKLIAIVWVIKSASMTSATIIPQTIELFSIATGDKGIPAYAIRVLPNSTEIEFRGGIRTGCADDLRKALEAAPQITVLHINSTGGRIAEARRMSDLVRQRDLITYTSEKCVSAATLVFVAGKERVVAFGARLGFHRSALPGATLVQELEMDAHVHDAMRAANISEAFIKRVLATPSDRMWYPTIEELRDAGVITDQSFGERFAVSGGLVRESSPEEIARQLDGVPVFRAIKDLEPDTYRDIVVRLSSAIQSGKTLAQALAVVHDTVRALMFKYISRASDEALFARRDLWIEILEKFKDRDSRACIAVFTPTSEEPGLKGMQTFPDWPDEHELTVIEKVFHSAAVGTVASVDEAKAQADAGEILQALGKQYRPEVLLLDRPEEWAEHSARMCDVLLALCRGTCGLPKRRQANVLRYLMNGR